MPYQENLQLIKLTVDTIISLNTLQTLNPNVSVTDKIELLNSIQNDAWLNLYTEFKESENLKDN